LLRACESFTIREEHVLFDSSDFTRRAISERRNALQTIRRSESSELLSSPSRTGGACRTFRALDQHEQDIYACTGSTLPQRSATRNQKLECPCAKTVEDRSSLWMKKENSDQVKNSAHPIVARATNNAGFIALRLALWRAEAACAIRPAIAKQRRQPVARRHSTSRPSSHRRRAQACPNP
jgi:hypothetical protein